MNTFLLDKHRNLCTCHLCMWHLSLAGNANLIVLYKLLTIYCTKPSLTIVVSRKKCFFGTRDSM